MRANNNPEQFDELKHKKHKYVLAGLLNDDQLNEFRGGAGLLDPGHANRIVGLEKLTYNFATGIWTSVDGNRKYKNGERVE